MGLRYRKSVRVGSKSRLNVSKSGVGVSTGTKGARFSVGPRGTRTTVGIPGTGVSYESRSSGLPSGCLGAIIFVVLAILVGGSSVIFFRASVARNSADVTAPTATAAADPTEALSDAIKDYISCDRVKLQDRKPLPKYNVDVEFDLLFECSEDTAADIMVNTLNKLRSFERIDDIEFALVVIYNSTGTRFRSGYVHLAPDDDAITVDDLEIDIQK